MAKIKLKGGVVLPNNWKSCGCTQENWEEDNKKQEKCLLFTEHQLTVAQDRASKNLEDIPKKGFWYNLFD